jgi:hypothetical protein
MFSRSLLLDKVYRLVEQILKAQQRAYALIERIFVCNHAAARSENRKLDSF